MFFTALSLIVATQACVAVVIDKAVDIYESNILFWFLCGGISGAVVGLIYMAMVLGRTHLTVREIEQVIRSPHRQAQDTSMRRIAVPALALTGLYMWCMWILGFPAARFSTRATPST